MIMKLKTLDQIKKEYSGYYLNGSIHFKKIDMLTINELMFHMFGKVHDFEIQEVKISGKNYNIYKIYDNKNDIYWYFHKDWLLKDWLLPVEFINEQEMIL